MSVKIYSMRVVKSAEIGRVDTNMYRSFRKNYKFY